MSDVTRLVQQLRTVVEGKPDNLQLQELLGLVYDFVEGIQPEHDQASWSEERLEERDLLVFNLEEELQTAYRELNDHSTLYPTEVFLSVLGNLKRILPPTTVISWFDILLRPALREPKLPTGAVNSAKELIISALTSVTEAYQKKVEEFRRYLMDLYLLDAYNETSGDDVLEWAELEEEQRMQRTRWKVNLEDILLKFGAERPEALYYEIYSHFKKPSARLQLLTFLVLHTSSPSFPNHTALLATHPIMKSVIRSLFLDASSTVCTVGLSLLGKLLPMMAVHARDKLKSRLPKMFAVLARVILWKERAASTVHQDTDEPLDPEVEKIIDKDAANLLPMSPDYDWERLEVTFTATVSTPPNPRHYFTMLYYLYPSNLIKFLNDPAQYLINDGVTNPYTIPWEKVLNQHEIRRKSEALIREHVCHPLLIWRDAEAELADEPFWSRWSASKIVSEAVMLDVRHNAIATIENLPSREGLDDEERQDEEAEREDKIVRPIRPIDLSSDRPKISLQDMVDITVALRSNIDVEIEMPNSDRLLQLYPPSVQVEPDLRSVRSFAISHMEVPPHVVEVISGLQREAVLLRNEMNFQLWLARENVKHIGRLYQDRVQAKTAEAERQGLYNKLRNYRNEVISLENQLREHKLQASSAKNKYADWNQELQKKLREFREEKKTWITEAAQLRTKEKEVQALFAAQSDLLADAQAQVFELQTQKKEVQHKIDRLQDYEAQIAQHIKMQSLWDSDFQRFNDRAEQIKLMQNQYKQLEIRLHAYEQTQAEMDDTARAARRQIQALEAQLSQAHTQRQHHRRQTMSVEITTLVEEKRNLIEGNKRLKNENIELRDEIEEIRAMVEVLKARKGLVSEPRASPVQFI